MVLRLASKHSRGDVKMIAGTQTRYRIKIRFTYQLRIKIQNGGSLKAKKTTIHKYIFFYLKKSINWDSAWCLRQRTNKVRVVWKQLFPRTYQALTSEFFRLDTSHGHSFEFYSFMDVLWFDSYFKVKLQYVCLISFLYLPNGVIFV